MVKTWQGFKTIKSYKFCKIKDLQARPCSHRIAQFVETATLCGGPDGSQIQGDRLKEHDPVHEVKICAVVYPWSSLPFSSSPASRRPSNHEVPRALRRAWPGVRSHRVGRSVAVPGGWPFRQASRRSPICS